MTQQQTTSFHHLLEEVERQLQQGSLEPAVRQHCIKVLATALQTTTNQAFPLCDMKDIRGNNHVKRALEVAAAGGHTILLSGPRQTGKTQLARTLPGILPAPVPFRSFDATLSTTALVGDLATPGELALAHAGVLLLKNLHTFDPSLLLPICQVVESQVVTFPHGRDYIHSPAHFLLIATAVSCPCGFYGDFHHECRCTAEAILDHWQRMGTFVEPCFDVHIEVSRVREDLLSRFPEESSSVVRSRVEQARVLQHQRYMTMPEIQVNADLRSVEDVQRSCSLDPAAEMLLRAALQQLDLTPQGILRMQKVARTIADLAGSELIMANHLAEAIQYRPRIGYKTAPGSARK